MSVSNQKIKLNFIKLSEEICLHNLKSDYTKSEMVHFSFKR